MCNNKNNSSHKKPEQNKSFKNLLVIFELFVKCLLCPTLLLNFGKFCMFGMLFIQRVLR